MVRSRTIIKTSNASKYLVQPSKHWNHQFDFAYMLNEAHISFSNKIRLDMFADPLELEVQIETPVEENACRSMEGVFVNYIVHFALRESLDIEWQREMSDH